MVHWYIDISIKPTQMLAKLKHHTLNITSKVIGVSIIGAIVIPVFHMKILADIHTLYSGGINLYRKNYQRDIRLSRKPWLNDPDGIDVPNEPWIIDQ